MRSRGVFKDGKWRGMFLSSEGNGVSSNTTSSMAGLARSCGTKVAVSC
jgi:hypothetical protein